MFYKVLSDRRLVNISILFMGLALLTFVLYQFQDFIRPFVIALILTFLFIPLTRLSRKGKMVVWGTTIVIAIGIIFLGTLLFGILINEVEDVDDGGYSLETTNNTLSQLFVGKELNLGAIKIDLNTVIKEDKILNYIYGLFGSFVDKVGNFFSQLMIVIIFLIFLLPSYDGIVTRYSESLTKKQANKFKKTVGEIENSIRKYLSIKSSISLVTAVLSGLIMFLFGVKYLVLFIFLTFVLNFIPSIGSIFAVLIVLGSQFLIAGFSTSLVFLGIILTMIQFTIGNIIEPKISGDMMNLSPIIILLSLFFWGAIWGLAGMFFSVPLTVTLKIILDNLLEFEGNAKA